MKYKKIPIYKFDELKPEIQERVLNWFRDNQDFYFLKDDLEEELKAILEDKKIEYRDLNIVYSLSYSQGDGFSFEGIIKTNKIEMKISNTSNYPHPYNSDIDLISYKVGKEFKDEYDLNDKQQDKAWELVNKFREEYIELCKKMEKIGYDIIEDTQSEENIKELIEINDYWFRESGELE